MHSLIHAQYAQHNSIRMHAQNRNALQRQFMLTSLIYAIQYLCTFMLNMYRISIHAQYAQFNTHPAIHDAHRKQAKADNNDITLAS